jgi:hypothetical protein
MELTKKYSFMKYFIPFESYEIVIFKYMRIENTALINYSERLFNISLYNLIYFYRV